MESIVMFPATIPFLLCIIVAVIQVFAHMKFKHGPKIIVSLFSFTAALIVFNYVWKIVDGTAFSGLHV